MSSPTVRSLPQQLIRQEILDLQAYHVPDSRGLIKLDAMENPYLLPDELQQKLGRLLGSAPINRYPDAAAASLRQKIAELLQLPDTMDVLLGNGSDELIQLLAMAVNRPGATLMGVEPSFVMYQMIASFVGMKYVGLSLDEHYQLDQPAMLQALETERPAILFLAYPNNPTGNLFDRAQIEALIEAAPGLVILDEAYYAFAQDSFIPDLERYPNLLVMRTFSKLGMAGLRLGYLAGHRQWLDQLNKLRLPYNIGVLSQLAAELLVDHHDILLKQADQIKQDRSWLWQQMSAIEAVQVYETQANFVLFKVAEPDRVHQQLKQQNILIKNLSQSGHALLSGCLRVTVGQPQENQKFIEALQHCVA